MITTRPQQPRQRPVGASGQPRLAAAGRLLRRHKTAAGSAVVVVAALTVGSAIAIAGPGGDAERHADSSHTPRVLAPADGDLRVAGVDVEQMVGSCDGTSCYHVPPAHPPVVDAGAADRLPLKAGQSTTFSVTAVDLDHPTKQVFPVVADGAIELANVPTGRYQVNVAGASNGGAWQFELDVDKAAERP